MSRRTNTNHNIEILLIEDDADDAKLVIEALQKNNIRNRILHLSNGDDAMKYLFGQEQPFDPRAKKRLKLILLDLKMPGPDGLHLLRTIRSNHLTRNISVIILSASARAEDLLECYQLGISSYVVKPHSAVEYEHEVSHLGVKKLLHN